MAKLRRPTKPPFASWKLFESSVHNGSAMMTTRTMARSAIRSVAVWRSSGRRRRLTRTCGGAVPIATSAIAASAPRRRGEDAQRLGRQRDQQALALCDIEVAHQVRREIGDERTLGLDLGREPRPAEGAEELEAPDLDRDRIGVARLDVADADLLGPQPELHGGAGVKPAIVVADEIERAGPDPLRPGDGRVEEAHGADEIGDEGGRRRAVDLGRRADLLDDAVVHHHDAVGHGERLLLVVGDHDGRDAEALLQGADLLAQAHPHLGVERRERLVEEEEVRRRRERAGERDALLLAARELPRVFAMLLGQADEREKLIDATLDLGRPFSAVDEPVADVAGDGQVREQGVGLEHDAEVALRRRGARHVAPGDPDPALVLRVEAGDGAQERGLAAAGRSEEAHELAAPDLEIDRLQGGEGAEALPQALDAQKRLLGHRRGITTVMVVPGLREAESPEPTDHARSAVGSGFSPAASLGMTGVDYTTV